MAAINPPNVFARPLAGAPLVEGVFPLYTFGNQPIFDKVTGRFQTTDFVTNPKSYIINRIIQPVTDVDKLMRTTQMLVSPTDFANIAVTSTGTKILFTAAAWTRYYVKFVNAILNTGTFTQNQLGLQEPAGRAMLVKSFTSAASIFYTSTDKDFILEPGWSIYTNVDAKTVNGDMIVQLLMEVELVGASPQGS